MKCPGCGKKKADSALFGCYHCGNIACSSCGDEYKGLCSDCLARGVEGIMRRINDVERQLLKELRQCVVQLTPGEDFSLDVDQLTGELLNGLQGTGLAIEIRTYTDLVRVMTTGIWADGKHKTRHHTGDTLLAALLRARIAKAKMEVKNCE